MRFSIHQASLGAAVADLVVIGVRAGELRRDPRVALIDRALAGALSGAARDQDFSGKAKELLVLHTLNKLRLKRVALVGLGAAPKLNGRDLVRFGATAARLANEVGAKRLLVAMPGQEAKSPAAVALVVRAVHLGCYRYTEYKSEKGRRPSLERLSVHRPGPVPAELGAAVRRAGWWPPPPPRCATWSTAHRCSSTPRPWRRGPRRSRAGTGCAARCSARRSSSAAACGCSWASARAAAVARASCT